MEREDNKRIARRFITEVADQGKLDALDELLSEDFIDHSAPPGQPPGREGAKQFVRTFREAFPAWTNEIEGMIAEDDTVVFWGTGRGVHAGTFMGIPATGKPISLSGIHVLKLRDGRIAEHLTFNDQLGLMRQLGLSPDALGAGSRGP